MKRYTVCVLAAAALAVCAMSCGREAPVGTLEITSEPAGLPVTIVEMTSTDKSETQVTTPASRIVAVGQYRLVPGHDPQELQVTPSSKDVHVAAAQLTSVAFTAARLGSLEVTSSPAGAVIWIDGADTGETTPFTFSLVEGDHEIALVLAGHVSDSGPQTVAVQPDVPASASFTLLPSGFVDVSSDPAGADIAIDGADTGETTPSVLELATGDHVVKVSRAGYTSVPDSLTVTVAEGDTAAAAFTLVAAGTQGDLVVTSVPPGAAITLDGADTGEVTPHTFSLTPTPHSVAVARGGFLPSDARDVAIVAGGSVSEEFTLVARKIVLVELVSGINCNGCPAMNTMLHNIEEIGGYHADRMLGIKISGPFGGPDQHYDANPLEFQTRMGVLANSTGWDYGAPTLFFDGDLPVAPNGYPGYGDLVMLLDAALATDPGFAIEARVADWNADPLEITIDLIPTREIDHDNTVLNVAVVENPVIYDEPPSQSFDETEFHWITREFEQVVTSPLPISPATPGHFVVTVPKEANWTGFDLENLWLIAFVQDTVTMEVLQAGAQIPDSYNAPTVPSERIRP